MKTPSRATEFDLRNGDCVEGMRTMEAASVDVIVTSPPYNLDISYRSFEDSAARDEFLDWCDVWSDEVNRVMREDGSFFLNLGASPKNPFLPHELLLRLREKFVLQNTIHWIKSITVEQRDGGEISVGHFKPINSPRYLNDCHEYLFHLTRKGSTKIDRLAIGVPYSDKSNINRWEHTKGNDVRCRGNTWFIPYKTIQNRDSQRPHPATFPVELARRCLALHGKGEQTVVLDPFLGIGHAALAAAEYGAKQCIGFEIDNEYLETARQQVAEVQGMLF
ncbi:MAG: site-specific DNA-methyltransferase [Verrucomicrobiota bacterium]|nr:site-specific DNA-methyltransferase [Verrucomicrobiota bacterium]